MKKNTSMILRPLHATDIPQLIAIAAEAVPYPWKEDVFKDCFSENYHGWALEKIFLNKNAEILGFVIVLNRQDECDLLNICLRPPYQGLHYGEKLLAKVLEWCQISKIQKIVLEVRRSNQQAIRFYKKMGFTEVAVRQNYYPSTEGREDALVFVRQHS